MILKIIKRKFFFDLKKELKKAKCQELLISSEHLSSRLQDLKEIKRCKKILHLLGFRKIKIIVYLREQNTMASSSFSTELKVGKNVNNIAKNENFAILGNYKVLLQKWMKVFGKENIIVRLFDKNEFYQGDLLKDFIHSIGLEWGDKFIIPPKQNETLDLIGIELLKRINKHLPWQVENKINHSRGDLSKYICQYFQNSKDPHLKFQPAKEVTQSYMDYFEESNEWVRKEFFPHKERLFPKKDLTNYKENYELKEMKPEYWDRIAEFIADIVKTKNQAIQNKDNQIATINNEKQKLIDEKLNLQIQINQLQNTLNTLPIKKQQLEISNLEQDLINKKLQTKQLERQLGLVLNDVVVSHGNKITIIHPNSAKSRIQNQLSYKLGQAMIANSKSILGYIRMPLVLSYIKDKHKQEQKIYQEKIKKDPSLKLPPLESYPDYKEALKEKECFTYKLGEALIKANKTWYKGGYVRLMFEIGRLKK
ncbi:hypothetical protein B10879_03580 [Campylobacter coli]|nr:hypothetical protein B10879_03580 [Campylobacter coli]